jgi:hypothetical protein
MLIAQLDTRARDPLAVTLGVDQHRQRVGLGGEIMVVRTTVMMMMMMMMVMMMMMIRMMMISLLTWR